MPPSNVPSLEDLAFSSIVDQLFADLGGDVRLVYPHDGALTALDAHYLGTLAALLREHSYRSALLEAVQPDIIVVRCARVDRGVLPHVRFRPSRLRVTKTHQEHLETLGNLAPLLNVKVEATRKLDTDLKGPALTFHKSFFAPRSIEGWAELSRNFAVLCAAMHELATLSGLKPSDVFFDHKNSHLIGVRFADKSGRELKLAQNGSF